MRSSRLIGLGVAGLTLAATASLTAAQGQVLDTSMRFYAAGGSYCFRLIPPGVDKSAEAEWTVMVLTSVANKSNSCNLGQIQQPGKSASDLIAEGLAVQIVWDENREEFFSRFVDEMKGGRLRARVAKTGPLKPGAAVSFAKVADLKPDEFQAFIKFALE